ncbi:hypothetical protein EDD11_000191 [Mortierella claussenii]|nr:hypothetical protein EDD11_000191 [Mortierella claussenii]
MDVTPLIIITVASMIIVSGTFLFCHKRREMKRRKQNIRITKSATPLPRYNWPHFTSDEIYDLPLTEDLQSSQGTNGTSPGGTTQYTNLHSHPSLPQIHPIRSNYSLHKLETQQQQQLKKQQPKKQQQKQSDDDTDRDDLDFRSNVGLVHFLTNQLESSRGRSPSPISPASMHYELAPLQAAYLGSGDMRLNQLHDMDKSLLSAPNTITQREISSSTNKKSLKRTESYQPSPLPRPLHLARPIITDTSITPSPKVIASISQSAARNLETDSRTPVQEATLITIEKSPALQALSASFGTTSQPRCIARKSAASVTPAATRQQQQQQQQPKQMQMQTPTDTQQPPNKAQSSVQQSGGNRVSDPFMSKEELERRSPQGILPAGFRQPVFTDLIDDGLQPAAVTDDHDNNNAQKKDTADDDSATDSSGPNTAFLVLEPYLTTAEQHFPAESVPSVPLVSSLGRSPIPLADPFPARPRTPVSVSSPDRAPSPILPSLSTPGRVLPIQASSPRPTPSSHPTASPVARVSSPVPSVDVTVKPPPSPIYAPLPPAAPKASSSPPVRPARRRPSVLETQQQQQQQQQQQAQVQQTAPQRQTLSSSELCSGSSQATASSPESMSTLSTSAHPDTFAVAAFALPSILTGRPSSPNPPVVPNARVTTDDAADSMTSSPSTPTGPSISSFKQQQQQQQHKPATVQSTAQPPSMSAAPSVSQRRDGSGVGSKNGGGGGGGVVSWGTGSSQDDRDRAISPVPSTLSSSGYSSNISAVLSIIPQSISSANTSFVSLRDSPDMSPIMDQASPTTATVHSPTTPSSARTVITSPTHAGPSSASWTPSTSLERQHFDLFLSKNDEDPYPQQYDHQHEKTTQELLAHWLGDPPSPETAHQKKKRIGDPQMGDFGTTFSHFNFVE